ncbi:MAG: 4Fe-4S binding protein, partial [Candidatus Bathyarchaeia archaeon]
GFPRVIALVNGLKEAGVKWVTPVNAAFGIPPPDIHNDGRALWPAVNANTFGAILGPWDRWLMFRDVAAISIFSPGMDMFAVGGLLTPEHVVQSMMYGAKTAGFSSAVLWKGRSIITRTVEFLKEYMEKHGYSTLEDFRGLALKHIVPVEKIDWQLGKIVSTTREVLCNSCGICADNICMARYMEDGVAKVREDDCCGCGLCVAVCPTNACTLIDYDTKKEIYARSLTHVTF